MLMQKQVVSSWHINTSVH